MSGGGGERGKARNEREGVGEREKYEAANKMTASEGAGEVKIYLILFLQDNSLVV